MVNVIVRNDAILQHQIGKEVDKPVALQKMVELHQSELRKATDPWYRSRVNYKDAAKNAETYKRNLTRVLPERLSPQAKDIMWRRAKALKDEFVVGMLSKEDMHPVKGFLDKGAMKYVVDEGRMVTNRCVERNAAWLRKNESKVREFKRLMRHLCPEDPSAGDIERFRPTRKL